MVMYRKKLFCFLIIVFLLFLPNLAVASDEEISEEECTDDINQSNPEKTQKEYFTREREMWNHPFNRWHAGFMLQGAYTVGTNTGLFNGVVSLGYKGFSGETGISIFPGIRRDRISELMGTSNDVSVMGLNFGLLYSWVFPKWHASLGNCFMIMHSREREDENTSIKTNTAFVPGIQMWLNWRLLDILFLRVGYKCDIYPEKYSYYFSSSTRDLKGIFLGHGIALGVLLTTEWL